MWRFHTTLMIQIDATGIIDKRSKEAREKTIQDLAVLHEELSGSPELQEVQWTRLRDLDFQEAMKQRNVLVERISKLECQTCENFEESVG